MGLRERIPLEGNGPRNMILNGDKLIIPTYFADILNIMDINTNEVTSVELNPGREETAENKGERYSTDASHASRIGRVVMAPSGRRTNGWHELGLDERRCRQLQERKRQLFSHVTLPT